MIVIDIEARALARDTRPAVQFRRTATDRPGRPWRLPNDGPAPDRIARAEALRETLRRRQTQLPQDAGVAKPETFERNMIRSLRLIADGKALLIDIAPALGFGVDRVRQFCNELAFRGLVTKTLEQRENVRVAIYTATEAGRKHLAGGGDDQR